MTGLLGIISLSEILVIFVLIPRLILGPSVSDRIVALNTIATQATLAVLFFSAYVNRPPYLDVALWLCSFSYLGTVVWSRYLERDLV